MSDLSQVKPLFIVWNQNFVQGRPIIDEQHRAVLATINSLSFFTQQGYDIKFLVPTIKILLNYIGFHYKTEEGILRATEYPEIQHYVEGESAVRDELARVYNEAVDRNEPQLVLQYLGDWWGAHMLHHEQVTPYLKDWKGEYCRVNEEEKVNY